jgi:hypothetical protein
LSHVELNLRDGAILPYNRNPVQLICKYFYKGPTP